MFMLCTYRHMNSQSCSSVEGPLCRSLYVREELDVESVLILVIESYIMRSNFPSAQTLTEPVCIGLKR